MSRKLFSAITLFTVVIFSALPAAAQAAPAKQATGESSASPMQTQSAVSTGAAHTAVLDGENVQSRQADSSKRAPSFFQDVAEKAGLTRWRHGMGPDDVRFIRETVGSGVALLDYGNDGSTSISSMARLTTQ